MKDKLSKSKIDLVDFMFVGLNEVANVFKSEAHISLKEAKRLSIQKLDTNIIRATTGWHQLDNGTWAYEISDKESSVSEGILEKIVRLSSPSINLKFNLQDLFKHEKLYKFAPSLKDTKVQIYFSNNKNEFGYFNNKDGTIYLNSNSYELIQHTNGISGSNERSKIGYVPEETDFRKNLLHEVQHIIQFKNGFPSGANFNQILERRIQETNKPKSELTENELAKIKYESAKEYLNNEGEKQANDTAERTALNEQERIDIEINKKAKEYTENVLGRLKDKIKFLRTSKGIIYGAKFPDGSIYLNPQQINANTPIHEFAHIWEELFPTEFAKGIELLMSSEKGRKYIKQIRQNPAYAGK